MFIGLHPPPPPLSGRNDGPGMNTLTGYAARGRMGEKPKYEHVPFVMVIR